MKAIRDKQIKFIIKEGEKYFINLIRDEIKGRICNDYGEALCDMEVVVKVNKI